MNAENSLSKAKQAPLTELDTSEAKSLLDPVFNGKFAPPTLPPPHYQKIVLNLPNKSINQILEEAFERAKVDVKTKFNFAFLGSEGCGKTALIGNLLGGNLGEEPRETSTRWTSSAIPEVVFWELQTNNWEESWFESQQLYIYDALVMVCVDHYAENELAIIKKALQWKIPLFFVLNKAELATESEGKLASLKELVQQQLEPLGLFQPFLYTTSTVQSEERLISFDEDKLMSDIVLVVSSRQ